MFDWLLVRAAGVARLIDRGFDGWLRTEALSLEDAPYAHVRDATCNVHFLHDFPLEAGFAADADRVRAKYAVLVQRWHLLMAADAAVLFVWKGDEGRDAVVPIADALRKARGARPFHLLALRSDVPEVDWQMPSVTNRFLRQPRPYDWKGDDAAWDDLFGVGAPERG